LVPEHFLPFGFFLKVGSRDVFEVNGGLAFEAQNATETKFVPCTLKVLKVWSGFWNRFPLTRLPEVAGKIKAAPLRDTFGALRFAHDLSGFTNIDREYDEAMIRKQLCGEAVP
jgi:hypothetical protein